MQNTVNNNNIQCDELLNRAEKMVQTIDQILAKPHSAAKQANLRKPVDGEMLAAILSYR